jgi:hypothetical protein
MFRAEIVISVIIVARNIYLCPWFTPSVCTSN